MVQQQVYQKSYFTCSDPEELQSFKEILNKPDTHWLLGLPGKIKSWYKNAEGDYIVEYEVQ